MKRWLPAPLLSATLFALWLLLNRSAAPGQLLAAAVVGLLVPLLSETLRPALGRVSLPVGPVARLLAIVAVDSLSSCAQVTLDVLRSGRREPRSAFVAVPLDSRDPHALALLAMITTVVPGTVWSELAADRSSVLLHVLDVADEAAFVAHYKNRYERPLREIFG